MTTGFDFPFSDFLEENPRASFFSRVNRFARPQQRHFSQSNAFTDIQNRFLGMLGSQARSGELPTLRFEDFLDDFNFDQEFRSLAPSERFGGGGQGRFAPPTRFRF